MSELGLGLYHAYKIITASTEATLQREVNDLMAKGWVPIGGVAVITGGGTNYTCCEGFCQAMIRK